jgi:hypothetical protein
LAHAAVARREIDRFLFVDEELDTALRQCGLRSTHLGRLRHFTDYALVELCCAHTDYLLHHDAEVDVDASFDWVSQGLGGLLAAPEVLVINPMWIAKVDVVLAESFTQVGPYAVAQGFSDQLFLTRRSALASPTYRRIHWASMRYPMASIGPIFEAWVDSYMRYQGLLRLVDLRARYRHGQAEGAEHSKPQTFAERMRHRLLRPQVRIGLFLSARRGRTAAFEYAKRRALESVWKERIAWADKAELT